MLVHDIVSTARVYLQRRTIKSNLKETPESKTGNKRFVLKLAYFTSSFELFCMCISIKLAFNGIREFIQLGTVGDTKSTLRFRKYMFLNYGVIFR